MSLCACRKNSTEQQFPELEEVMEQYAPIKGSLITILQKAQDIYGYLSKDLIRYISERIGIAPADIYGVATFYTQFRLEPIGTYLIMLCKGTACHVNGAPGIEEAICEHLRVADGGTTDDGVFTLNVVSCLGCCSLAPVMMVKGPHGEETFGRLTKDSVRTVLDEIAARVSGECS
jgi:NADH-quinone oxidoreductase subunit E